MFLAFKVKPQKIKAFLYTDQACFLCIQSESSDVKETFNGRDYRVFKHIFWWAGDYEVITISHSLNFKLRLILWAWGLTFSLPVFTV